MEIAVESAAISYAPSQAKKPNMLKCRYRSIGVTRGQHGIGEHSLLYTEEICFPGPIGYSGSYFCAALVLGAREV